MSGAHGDSVADPSWFSVRCMFRGSDDTPTSYEERLTVWRAVSFEEAIALAEAEASDYAELSACVISASRRRTTWPTRSVTARRCTR